MLIDAAVRREIAKVLDTNQRTVSNLLKKLVARNWVGYNPASGYYFIRGFQKVREIEGMRGRRGVIVDVNKDITDHERFKAFLMGATIGWMANVGRYKKEREQRESERYKVRSNHHSRRTAPSFPVACKALSAMLGIASSTASVYKTLAAKYGFIQVQKQLERLPLANDPKVKDAHLVAFYKAANPEDAHLVVIVRGKAFLQGVDLIIPCMHYSKKGACYLKAQKIKQKPFLSPSPPTSPSLSPLPLSPSSPIPY